MSETTETAARVQHGLLGDDLCALIVVHHPDPAFIGAYQALTAERYDVGRDAGGLFPGLFDHKRVSRTHATLHRVGERLRVRDEGSRNGTYVNGHQIKEAALEPGDTLRVGPVVLLHRRGPRHYDEPAGELFVGVSHALARLIEALEAAGKTGQPVMLIGETGVGKELAAKLVHEASGRTGPLVAVNCGAIADGVVSSELFGHVRGAFSGAATERQGLVDEARGGTLFLDEVGSASPTLQATLLRLLENREYRVVGDTALRRADVRFVAATHPDVRGTMRDGTFRQDLWFRLAHRVVDLPPLREHAEDIPALIRHRLRGQPLELSPELVDAMVRYEWPGNVRELLAMVDGWAAEPHRARTLEDWHAGMTKPVEPAVVPKTRRPSREELVERLLRHGASISAVAKTYGVSRKSVYRWVETLGVDLADLRDRVS